MKILVTGGAGYIGSVLVRDLLNKGYFVRVFDSLYFGDESLNELKNNPNFAQALIALGEIYTKKGLYDKGLNIDKRLLKLKPDSPIVHYNLACSLSLLGDISASFKAIKRAIDLGYDDFPFMHNDPDLSNLRSDERFLELIKKVKNQQPCYRSLHHK